MAGGFSPDGKWVAATINYAQLVLLPTGAGTARHLDPADIQQYSHPVLWLPDGKQVVFPAKLAGHQTQCFIQNSDGGKPRAVTPEGVSWCRPSPDGKSIAARDIAGSQTLLYPVNGGQPHAIAGILPGENFTWTTDPKYMYVNQWQQLPIKIYRLNIVSGQRQVIKEIESPPTTQDSAMSAT